MTFDNAELNKEIDKLDHLMAEIGDAPRARSYYLRAGRPMPNEQELQSKRDALVAKLSIDDLMRRRMRVVMRKLEHAIAYRQCYVWKTHVARVGQSPKEIR